MIRRFDHLLAPGVRGAFAQAHVQGLEDGRLLDRTAAEILARDDERRLRLPPIPDDLIPALQAEADAQAAPAPEIPTASDETVRDALAQAAEALLDLARTVARAQCDPDEFLHLEAEHEARAWDEFQFRHGLKRCATCDRWAALEDFLPDRGRFDTLAPWCVRCVSAARIRLP